MNHEAGPTFIQFVLTKELHTFINSKGVDRVARLVVEVLHKIKEAGVDQEEWLRQLREARGFTGDESELLKAISAYKAAHAQRIDIRSGELRPVPDGAGWRRRDVMSVSLDQSRVRCPPTLWQ